MRGNPSSSVTPDLEGNGVTGGGLLTENTGLACPPVHSRTEDSTQSDHSTPKDGDFATTSTRSIFNTLLANEFDGSNSLPSPEEAALRKGEPMASLTKGEVRTFSRILLKREELSRQRELTSNEREVRMGDDLHKLTTREERSHNQMQELFKELRDLRARVDAAEKRCLCVIV